MKIKNRNLTKIALGFAVLASGVLCQAQGGSGFGNHFAYPVAVGISRVETVNAGASNTFHAMAEIKSDIWVGLGFGFYNSFDSFLLNGNVRKILESKSNYALYTELQTGLARGGGANSVIGGVLLGFEYSLAKQLRMSFGYGIQFGLGSSVPRKLGFTNSDFVGNFGLHWFL